MVRFTTSLYASCYIRGRGGKTKNKRGNTSFNGGCGTPRLLFPLVERKSWNNGCIKARLQLEIIRFEFNQRVCVGYHVTRVMYLTFSTLSYRSFRRLMCLSNGLIVIRETRYLRLPIAKRMNFISLHGQNKNIHISRIV